MPSSLVIVMFFPMGLIILNNGGVFRLLNLELDNSSFGLYLCFMIRLFFRFVLKGPMGLFCCILLIFVDFVCNYACSKKLKISRGSDYL